MIGLNLGGCVHKKWVKMRNKNHFTTSWYILLYFVFCHIIFIICILSEFSTPSQNLTSIEVTWKLGYLRRLDFVPEKWLRGHTSCLRTKWLICFRMWWQTFSQKMWVMGRDVPQDHENNEQATAEFQRSLSFEATNKYCMSGKLNHT